MSNIERWRKQGLYALVLGKYINFITEIIKIKRVISTMKKKYSDTEL